MDKLILVQHTLQCSLVQKFLIGRFLANYIRLGLITTPNTKMLDCELYKVLQYFILITEVSRAYLHALIQY